MFQFTGLDSSCSRCIYHSLPLRRWVLDGRRWHEFDACIYLGQRQLDPEASNLRDSLPPLEVGEGPRAIVLPMEGFHPRLILRDEHVFFQRRTQDVPREFLPAVLLLRCRRENLDHERGIDDREMIGVFVVELSLATNNEGVGVGVARAAQCPYAEITVVDAARPSLQAIAKFAN